MKAIFLDIDGVLINRNSFGPLKQSGTHSKPDPECVTVLNSIIEQTGAFIVISSTWRAFGLMRMKDFLLEWGVKGTVIGLTPDSSHLAGKDIALYLARTRGDEIQEWLTEYDKFKRQGPLESFVILDDDIDMKHLTPRLVKTEFDVGLTKEDAEKAIGILSVPLHVIRLEACAI